MKMTWITGLGCVVLTALTACGPLQQDNANNNALKGVLAGITGAVASDGAGDVTAGDSGFATEGQTLTRAFIDAQDVGLLRLSILSRDATGLVFFGRANGSKVTWLSLEGVSFVFDDGLLVGTRGSDEYVKELEYPYEDQDTFRRHSNWRHVHNSNRSERYDTNW
jgi:hypothetical protein